MADERPTVPGRNFIEWRVENLEKRFEKIDGLKLDVLVDRVAEMRDEIHGLRRAFYTFAFSVVGSAVVFAFTVFSLIGK